MWKFEKNHNSSIWSLNLWNHSPDEPLPIEAQQLGIKKEPFRATRKQPFQLHSGPLKTDAVTSPLEAFFLFFNEAFQSEILKKGKNVKKVLAKNLSVDKGNLLRYTLFVLAAGIARFPRERLIFRKNDYMGLTSNEFLSSILSYDELVEAKVLFSGDRDALTQIFNDTMKELWRPFQ